MAALVVVAAVGMAMAVVVVVVGVLAVVVLFLRMIPCYQKPRFLRLLKRGDRGTGGRMEGRMDRQTDRPEFFLYAAHVFRSITRTYFILHSY